METSGIGAAAGIEDVAPSDGAASAGDITDPQGTGIGFECLEFRPGTSLISRMVSMIRSMLPESGACAGMGI